MFGEEEQFFHCPYCWAQVSMLLETQYGSQEYIEDCEVCCQPIKIQYSSEGGEITSFEATKADE